ncbi:iron sulfur assembly protein [Blumeria hordei DH14]|uniref:Iron-sulfur assembly protein 1 n=1 Tax=Blumeria graminis f. sp. hordei (strain DH14) TaxID=546991 RepID=N1J8A4_BLUG1|nr:iron sulfur assembly protein [Blumeria hordei DH14]
MAASRILTPANLSATNISRLASGILSSHSCNLILRNLTFANSQKCYKREIQSSSTYPIGTLPDLLQAQLAEKSDGATLEGISKTNDSINHTYNTPKHVHDLGLVKELNQIQSGREEQTTISTTNHPTPAGSKPRPKLRAKRAAISLSQAAVKQLRTLLDLPSPKLIKIGVRNRGCSGLAYHLEYVDKPGPFDEEVEQDGVKVIIDGKALFSIIGSEMDWEQDKLSQRFVFKNPNIKEQCGCGESFMV